MEQLFAVGSKKRARDAGLFIDLEDHRGGFTLKEAKSMLFLSQIFHILFPKNSPQPIRIRKEQHGGYSIAFEKIPHDALHSELNDHRMKEYRFWRSMQGVAIPIQDPKLQYFREELKKLESKLSVIENDPAFEEICAQMRECGFGELYELKAYNFIKDASSNEYVFIDHEPALQQYFMKGSWKRLGVPKKVTVLRIPLDKLERSIHGKLTGISHKIALEYLVKLKELLPRKYETAFTGHHESKVIVLQH